MTPALARARFSQLILPRLDEGYRLARWLTGSATDAEDVMQEASLRAFRAIESFAEGNIRAWFLTIVRNASYSWLARHRSHLVISCEDMNPGEVEAEMASVAAPRAETPESALISKEETARIAAAIDALAVPLKEALVLREYHGLSYREIAGVAGVPIGTVMSRLARARAQLLAQVDMDQR